jgi:prepilin-type N-terminal cleavage/methylation domain-containing protein
MTLFKKAFTMLELVFVIVVLGIIGTVGAEVFRTMYDAYTSSAVNNKLQMETELTLKQIANRLQYRFKDSVIARETTDPNAYFNGLSSYDTGNADNNATVIEWIGYDVDGWQGTWDGTLNYNRPTWSGFIDVDARDETNTSILLSPSSDTGLITTMLADLSPSGATFDDTAIFFTGANTDPKFSYDWNNSVAHNPAVTAAHRLYAHGTDDDKFVADDYFSGLDVYEQYKLAWTAYALVLQNEQLTLYYDYRPWEGEKWQDDTASSAVLIDHVDTFKFQAIGDIIKVQLCINNDWYDNLPTNQIYSICKEKVIF